RIPALERQPSLGAAGRRQHEQEIVGPLVQEAQIEAERAGETRLVDADLALDRRMLQSREPKRGRRRGQLIVRAGDRGAGARVAAERGLRECSDRAAGRGGAPTAAAGSAPASRPSAGSGSAATEPLAAGAIRAGLADAPRGLGPFGSKSSRRAHAARSATATCPESQSTDQSSGALEKRNVARSR